MENILAVNKEEEAILLRSQNRLSEALCAVSPDVFRSLEQEIEERIGEYRVCMLDVQHREAIKKLNWEIRTDMHLLRLMRSMRREAAKREFSELVQKGEVLELHLEPIFVVESQGAFNE